MPVTWSDVCFATRIIYSGSYGHIGVCDSLKDKFYDDMVLVYTDSPWYARRILEWLAKYHAAIAHVASLLIDDLSMLRGTHAEKNRVIARIAKFVRLLSELDVELKVMPWDLASITAYKLYMAWRIERHITVLNAFKGHVHRIRDPVHELIYPHIRRDIERLKHVKLFAAITSGPEMVCDIMLNDTKDLPSVSVKCELHGRYWSRGEEYFIDIDVDPWRLTEKMIERKSRGEKREPAIPDTRVFKMLYG